MNVIIGLLSLSTNSDGNIDDIAVDTNLQMVDMIYCNSHYDYPYEHTCIFDNVNFVIIIIIIIIPIVTSSIYVVVAFARYQ